MKINLEKELRAKTADHRAELQEFNALKEVRLLLEHTEQEERNVLKAYNLDEHLVRAEKEQGLLIESEKFEAEFGSAFNIKHIGHIAKQYRLRFLPLDKFKGAIDPLLATKMVAFGKKHNIDPSKDTTGFYVLAPSEDFRLEETKHHRPRPVVSQDPLLFYKLDRTGEVWTLIHKWGSEFNYMRMIRSLKYRNEAYYVAHWSMVFTALFLLAFTVLIGGYTLPMWAIMAVSSVLGVAGGFIKYSCLEAADEANLFTEKNWTDSSYHKMVNWDE